MRSPTLTIVSGGILLALASAMHRLAVEARDAVQRLARRYDMDARKPARARCAAGRPARGTARRRGRGDARLRRRKRGRGPATARDDQMLARTHSGRTGDAVGFHDGGDRHAIAARDRFERLAGRHRDRRAAFPGPARRRRRGGGSEPVTSPLAGLVRAHAAAAAGGAIAAIAARCGSGWLSTRFVALRDRAGHVAARGAVSEAEDPEKRPESLLQPAAPRPINATATTCGQTAERRDAHMITRPHATLPASE